MTKYPASSAAPDLLRLVDRLPIGLYATRGYADGAFELTYVSEVAGRMLDLDPDALMRDATLLLDLVHPDDLPGMLDRNRVTHQTSSAFQWEGRFRVRGAWRTLYIHSEPEARDQDTGIIEWRGFLEDVTERVASQAALRLSEERHRILAENALDVIWTMSPDGRITHISPSVEALRGYTVEEAMGQPIDQILTPASIAMSIGYFGGLLTTLATGGSSSPFRGEEEYRCKDGGTVWCDVIATPILADDGTLVEVLGVSRDLTARKRLEAELIAARDAAEAARAGLDEAQRLAGVGSWTLELETGAVTWSNEMYRIFGQEPGSPARPFDPTDGRYSAEDVARRERVHAHTLATGEPWDIEYEIVRSDGARRQVAGRGEAVLDATGRVVGLQGTVADITERRAAERRLAESVRLKAIGRLAGGVAHEFNNMLMVMMAGAELLAESLPEDDPRREDARSILTSGARAADLVHQLLAYGRRQILHKAPVDVADAVAELVPLLRQAMGGAVEVRYEAAQDVERVLADRSRLQDAVMGLALNARDAMPDGGELSISVASARLDAATGARRPEAVAGPHVRVRIGDTGEGITPEAMPHLFEPFYSTNAFGEGSGLGLATIEGIVAMTGGWIDVETETGRGSTFTINLPAMTPGSAGPVTAGPGASASGPVATTVLLVDDEPLVLAGLARLVRSLGYEVVGAAGSGEALALTDETLGAADVLITDIAMPGMGGVELARRLAERRPGLPVLFVSGYSPDAGLQERLDRPDAAYLGKPFERADLDAALRNLLGDPAQP